MNELSKIILFFFSDAKVKCKSLKWPYSPPYYARGTPEYIKYIKDEEEANKMYKIQIEINAIIYKDVKCYQHGIEYHEGDDVPEADGCNSGYYCHGGKIVAGYTTLIGCGPFNDCIKDDKVIRHLAVFPSDDSCNKCDCFNGKISCTYKDCGKLQKIHPNLNVVEKTAEQELEQLIEKLK